MPEKSNIVDLFYSYVNIEDNAGDRIRDYKGEKRVVSPHHRLEHNIHKLKLLYKLFFFILSLAYIET